MTAPNLTPRERAIYDAARAEAQADRWRIEGDIEARNGKPAAISREYQRQYEAEAADAWRRLAALKGEAIAQAAE